jgi:RHS repeat-associated protein
VLTGDKNVAKLVWTASAGWKLEYHLIDHLGSRQVVCEADGTVKSDPDGEMKYSTFGEYEDGAESEYSYTGKQRDSATGLSYFNARFYDPAIGRFVTMDPIKDGSNWYVYCGNNPLKYVDPDGLEEIEILIGLDPSRWESPLEQLSHHLSNFYTSTDAYGYYSLLTGLSVNYNSNATKNDFINAYTSDETKYMVIFSHGLPSKAWVGDDNEIATLRTFEGFDKGENLLAIFILACHQSKFNAEWNEAAGVLVVTFSENRINQMIVAADIYKYTIPTMIAEFESEGLIGTDTKRSILGRYYRGMGHGYGPDASAADTIAAA